MNGMNSGWRSKLSPAIRVRVAPGAAELTGIPRGAELLGQVPGRDDEAALHRRVGRVPCLDAGGQDRPAADVDDRAAVGEQRQQRPGEEARALEQDPRELVEQLLGSVRERGPRQPGPGVVDQDVEVLQEMHL
jgi:hypothetical protein